MRTYPKIRQIVASSQALWFVIIFGILARLAQYLSNRSLWLDEASLALKITDFSFQGLLLPASQPIGPYMVQYQAAPFGFLAIEKLFVQLLGNHELVLRLLPFFAGIGSIFLFYVLAKRCLKHPLAIFFGLCVFASSEYLVYYSAELKPYAVDVLVALLLTLQMQSFYGRQVTPRSVVLAGGLAALSIWVSFPAVFVVIGAGAGLLWISWTKKQRDKMFSLVFVAAACAVSFFLYYFVFLRSFMADERLSALWVGTYAPVYPLTMYDIPWYTVKWYYYNFFKIFQNPVGLFFHFISGILFLAGCREFFKKRPEFFYILLGPILATLIASMFEKYPFHGRMLLFLVPALIIFVAAGVERFSDRVYPRWPLVVWSLVGLLLVSPVVKAGSFIVKPILREEIKPCLAYLGAHRQPGDTLYVYFAAENALRYYAGRYGLNDMDHVIGTALVDLNNLKRETGPDDYKKDLDRLRGKKRAWVLFSHAYDGHEESFLSYLDGIGTRKDSFGEYGASVYLYDVAGATPAH